MIDAKYFDIFGLAGFLILFFIGLSIRKMFKKRAWVVILISLIGIVVDGYVVLTNFVLK